MLARILVVEDELQIRRFLRTALGSRGFEVEEADTLAAARLQCTARPPDVILLDLGLPDGDGIELVREVRGWSNLPIVVLSARGQETDKVAALDAGADDYLTKPFGVPELLARLRVALRHARRGADAEATWSWSGDGHGFRLDATRHLCWRCEAGTETEVRLTPTEFRVLLCLARHHGKVLTHTQLLREVWGPQHDGDVAYLRVYLGQLRQKLEPEPARPRWLLTEPGVGYRLVGADGD
ncbi:MAG: response regulator [Planctomycetes bacterium]|nr:response regulator [Planctomycetota bacterium]